MLDYRKMLQLNKQGASANAIAKLLGCKWDTVKRVLSRCENEWGSINGVPEDLSNEQIADQIFINRFKRDEGYLLPDAEKVLERQAKGDSRNELWLEYIGRAKSLGLKSYKISRFNELVSEYASKNDLSHLLIHNPGLEGQVDWVGDKVYIIDRDTGEQVALHIFVLSLPFSGYFYAEAFYNEKMDSWLNGHKNALTFFGGCPSIIVPDNCRTAITRARKGISGKPAVINAKYAEFAQHYGFIIKPARAYRPKDKAHVERTVKLVKDDLLRPLSKLTFFSIEEYNRMLMRKLVQRMNVPYSRRNGSRASIFEEEEKKMLLPLPALEFQSYTQKRAVVGRDAHIQFDSAYYSVPVNFIKETVMVKATVSQILIFRGDGNFITEHPRALRKWMRVTNKDHLPINSFSHDIYTREEFLSKAKTYGDELVQWCESVLDRFEFEVQGFRTLSSTLAKISQYHPDVVKEAAYQALCTSTFSTRGFQIIARKLQQERIDGLTQNKLDLNALYCAHKKGAKS